MFNYFQNEQRSSLGLITKKWAKHQFWSHLYCHFSNNTKIEITKDKTHFQTLLGSYLLQIRLWNLWNCGYVQFTQTVSLEDTQNVFPSENMGIYRLHLPTDSPWWELQGKSKVHVYRCIDTISDVEKLSDLGTLFYFIFCLFMCVCVFICLSRMYVVKS